MKDKRKNLRKHIKAASDWLQQADKSIEREEDLKGDLKLMLAKAELQNAEKHQNRSRLTKIFSLLTAVLIAVLIFFINNYNAKVPQLATPSVSITNSPDSPTLEVPLPSAPVPLPEVSTESDTEQKNFEVPNQILDEQSQISESDESDTISSKLQSNEIIEFNESNPNPELYIYNPEPEPIAEDLNLNQEPVPNFNQETNNISLEARAPTEDMQKLMQSAGQILRAE